MVKVGLIGGGNMGEALIKGVQKDFSVCVSETSKKRRVYLRRKYKTRCININTLIQKSKVIILAVKPQDIDAVLSELAQTVKKDKLILSIEAGITTRYIEKKIGRKVRVVRSMPNMPALIGEGITAVCVGRYAQRKDLTLAKRILGKIGEVVTVQEKHIDSVTAVSGSGPAYVYLFMECMIQAARSLGLKKDLAKKLVVQTFSGSVHLLAERKEKPGQLRAKVTSKGGTTQAAYNVFMKKKLNLIINQALKAAQKRAKELSRG